METLVGAAGGQALGSNTRKLGRTLEGVAQADGLSALLSHPHPQYHRVGQRRNADQRRRLERRLRVGVLTKPHLRPSCAVDKAAGLKRREDAGEMGRRARSVSAFEPVLIE